MWKSLDPLYGLIVESGGFGYAGAPAGEGAGAEAEAGETPPLKQAYLYLE